MGLSVMAWISDLLSLVHFLLRIEEGNVSGGILLGVAGRVYRRHQRLEFRHIVRILEVEGGGISERSFGHTIKRIGHKNGISVTFRGNTPSNGAHRGPQAECVRPDQYSRMETRFRTNECGVASSVRSLDLDVGFDHFKPYCRCRLYRSSEARSHQEGCKVAPCDVSKMRVVRRLVFLVVRHGCSFNEFIAFGHPTS